MTVDELIEQLSLLSSQQKLGSSKIEMRAYGQRVPLDEVDAQFDAWSQKIVVALIAESS